MIALCKSSTLAFVLVFAFLFRLEKPSFKLIAVIATITIGVVLMVATESEFVLTGSLSLCGTYTDSFLSLLPRHSPDYDGL